MFGHPSYIHSDRGSSFLSKDLHDFLLQRGIATSHSTPYHPESNGQAERYNSTIWKTTKLILRSKDLPISKWQDVIPEALHSVRSLLCVSTNTTPHERFLSFPRRTSTGSSIPSWLLNPGSVYLKNYSRSSKNDPLVQEVELIHTNPQYAQVKFPDGKESTVSLQHLAPMPPRSTTDHSIESQQEEDKVEEEPPVHAKSPTINECDQSPFVETITPPCTTEIPTTPMMENH